MKTANPTQTKKLAIIDNSIGFFSPVERFAEKLIKTAGNEPARLCHPHAYVKDGFLHVVAATILLVLAPATPASIVTVLAGYLLVFAPSFLFLAKKQQNAKDNIASEQEQFVLRIGAYTD